MSHPIFAHSKENKVPQTSAAHAGQFGLPPCLVLLSAVLLSELLACLLLFSAAHTRYAPRCTFINCLGLCQSYSVIFSAALGTAFPQQGKDLSFLYYFWQNEKKKLSLTPSEWEDEWSVRHSFSNVSFVLWGSLSPGHMWEEWGKQCCAIPTDSRWWPFYPTSVRCGGGGGAVRVAQRSSQLQDTWCSYILSRTHTFFSPSTSKPTFSQENSHSFCRVVLSWSLGICRSPKAIRVCPERF